MANGAERDIWWNWVTLLPCCFTTIISRSCKQNLEGRSLPSECGPELLVIKLTLFVHGCCPNIDHSSLTNSIHLISELTHTRLKCSWISMSTTVNLRMNNSVYEGALSWDTDTPEAEVSRQDRSVMLQPMWLLFSLGCMWRGPAGNGWLCSHVQNMFYSSHGRQLDLALLRRLKHRHPSPNGS